MGWQRVWNEIDEIKANEKADNVGIGAVRCRRTGLGVLGGCGCEGGIRY